MPHRKFESANIKPRYSKGRISVLGINSVYPRTPWVTAWWSAAFPGFGHMYIGKYLHGFILVIWELVVNNMSHLNMAIAYSFLGRFEEAKAVIDKDWGLLYIAVFVFSIWDSYRSAVEIKKNHMLSEIEDAPVTPSDINFFDIATLDEKSPLVGMLWSVFSPGLGQLYGGSTVVGTFILAWWITICYKAMAVRTWLYSFLGDFHSAAAVVDWQWFLFLPSIHRVDGRSMLDGAMMVGSLFAVLGAIYGFVLYWGPIIWGLIGLAGGFILGLFIEMAFNKKKKLKLFASRKSEVIIGVTCPAALQKDLIQLFKIRKAEGYVIVPQRLATTNS